MLATWWQQATPGTTYWRCTVPAKALPGQALQLLNTSLKDEYDGVRLDGQVGASIWQFPGNATRALIMAHVQSEGGKVLVEVDDNYLLPAPRIPGHVSAWQTKFDTSPEDRYSHQAHASIVRWVDGVIVSTPVLAEAYSQATSAPIYVCPNSADLDDWPPLEKRTTDLRLRIGYAGSDSHLRDVSLIARALKWASEQRHTEVWKLGLKTVEWKFRHRIFPWTDDLASYRRNLQTLDVGLCPLKRSAWHDGKSDIKAIELALAGALPIVQADSPCYAGWPDVVPSAKTEAEWRKAVKWAISSPDEVKELAAKARAYVLERKLIGQHIDKWREAVA